MLLRHNRSQEVRGCTGEDGILRLSQVMEPELSAIGYHWYMEAFYHADIWIIDDGTTVLVRDTRTWGHDIDH